MSGTAPSKTNADVLELGATRDIRVVHAEKDAGGERKPKFAATVIDYAMQDFAGAVCEQIGIAENGALADFLKTDAGKAWRKGGIQFIALVTTKAAAIESK